jgi:arylsulfatase A-like enzyme
VTIDTLRADRLGIYGARDVETPNIDRLAREGAWAPQAAVHVPLTRPSHVSLFTGRYPAEHGVRDNVSPPLAADVPVLTEGFQRAGVPTAAFIASAVLDRQSGLARGFDLYSDRFEPGADRKPGDEVAAEAIAWMQRQLARRSRRRRPGDSSPGSTSTMPPPSSLRRLTRRATRAGPTTAQSRVPTISWAAGSTRSARPAYSIARS